MLTLYYAPATASMCVHQLLIELGAEHELEKVDLESRQQKSPEYLRLNPNGVVPTLIIDDAPMFESSAILMYLAERYPHAGFSPGIDSPSRRFYLQWFLQLANALQPAYRNWFYPTEPAGEAAVDAVKASAKSRIEAAFDQIDAHLAQHGPYVCGEHITAVDFFLFMLMRWSRNMPKPATEWAHCRAFVTRMKARESFKTLYAREGLTDWA